METINNHTNYGFRAWGWGLGPRDYGLGIYHPNEGEANGKGNGNPRSLKRGCTDI